MSAPRQEQTILTPSQVGQYIKGFMDRDRVLSGLLVRGELSNYKMYPSGHHYFTLKDGEGALRCVMFRGDAASLRFHPQNGMQVIAAGRVTVFPRDGQYQLYCVRLTPEGAGDLAVAFEQMKARLLQEGLFDRAHKRPLPRIPGRIALVTSPAGAAVRDMLRILGARWPMAQIRILPVRVQGEGAAEEIAAAIRWANLHQAADLIITGRGGGSMEDLWAFNEECVARAVYDSQIPVISAVGHEPDVTIADFTADLRAATPSNAAELAVPDQNEVYAALASLGARMEQASRQRLLRERQRLERRSAALFSGEAPAAGLSEPPPGTRPVRQRIRPAGALCPAGRRTGRPQPLEGAGPGIRHRPKEGRERDRLGPGRLPRGALFPAAVGRTGGMCGV